jgi:hypothetical protein
VLDLRTRELEAWTAFRTRRMPDIDKIGQSMASMGIANVHMMRHQLDPLDLASTLEQARTDSLLEGDDSPAAVAQRQTVRSNGLQLELFAATRLLHKQVRVRGLVNTAHYNGRLGEVLRVHEPARYEAPLHAVSATLEVCVIIHERNLERV